MTVENPGLTSQPRRRKPEWEIRMDRIDATLDLIAKREVEAQVERAELRQTMGRLAKVVARLGIIIAPMVSEDSVSGD